MRAWAKMLAAAAFWSFGAAHAQDAAQIPVEAFGDLPAIADAALSPDGSMLALAQWRNPDAVISVINLDTNERVYAGAMEEGSQLRGVGWADDGRLSYMASRTYHPGAVLPANVRFRGAPRRVDFLRTGIVDLATQRTRTLTINPNDQWADQGAYLVAPIEGDPGFARMVGRAPYMGTAFPTVFRVNLDNGVVRRGGVRGINEQTVGFIFDAAGAVVARADSDPRTNHWRVFVYDGEYDRLLLEDVSDTGAPIDLVGLIADGRIAALDEREPGGRHVLFAIDRATGAREILFEREDADIAGGITDPWTRQVVGVHWSGETSGSFFFDPEMDQVAQRVSARFSEVGAGWITSWSRDRRRYLAYGELGLDGGAHYIYTPADDRLARIGALYPQLADANFGVRQEISYPARDRTRIPAYLTLPAVEQAENLPLIVLVHGGPHARDTIDFDWWSAFHASRGYAVLQPNFRGSSGYGQAWEDAGKGQWGGLMQTDVEDGVVALARVGVIDPARVCIIGASYGGYAALAGATLTPDRYKCAASVAGVSDLEEFLRQRQAMSGEDSMMADFWRLSIGDREEDRPRIRAASPARLTANVRIPVLLIHGTDDTVVPIAQSRIMLDRLRDAGKDVRFVELRGDDHWLSDAPTRIQMLRELDSFLAQHLGEGAR